MFIFFSSVTVSQCCQVGTSSIYREREKTNVEELNYNLVENHISVHSNFRR